MEQAKLKQQSEQSSQNLQRFLSAWGLSNEDGQSAPWREETKNLQEIQVWLALACPPAPPTPKVSYYSNRCQMTSSPLLIRKKRW